MKMKYKFIHILSLFVLVCLLFATSAVVGAAASTREGELIRTRTEFEKALNNAKDGDTLVVGDIDFNLAGEGAVNEAERITIAKNITIENGKSDGNAVFKGASFILNGTNTAGQTSDFSFVGITFEEELDTNALTDADWAVSYYSDGTLISSTPLKCQFAIECQGSATARFTDCDFKNYMSPYGAAIQAYYLSDENLTCFLNIELEGCNFENNAALNGGGAIYIESNDKNVTLSVKNCRFNENRSGFAQSSVGGGAVRLYGCSSEFENCKFTGNTANHFYGGDRFFDYGFIPELGESFLAYEDNIKGGAILVSGGTISMRACEILGNAASFGGGLALEICEADIEDCVISDNKAVSVLDSDHKNSTYGVGSNNGIGGALYVDGAKSITVGNTEISGNHADNAFGAIYSTYVTYDSEWYDQFSLRFLFCSIRDNTCSMKISDYTNDAGWWEYDIHAIPYIETYGSIVIDSIYGTDIPRSEEPTEKNGYNYFGSSAPEEWEVGGHLLNAPTISTDFVKETLGDRNYYGTFTVGANNHNVTYRFFADGKLISTESLEQGQPPSVPTFETPGYTLTSWTLTDFEYREDKPFVVGNATESVDVHAILTPNTYTVTFDFGNAQSTEVKQIYNTALVFPEAPERYNYTFKGWYTGEGGEGKMIEDGALFSNAGDITYYAFYEKDFPILIVIIACVGVVLTGGLIALAIIMYKRRHHFVPVAVEGAAAAEQKPAPDISMLSPREKEVLTLLLEGKQRNEIAATLYISENTVKKQITSIYSKLGVSTRNELFALFK